MLEGLEISVIYLSEVVKDNDNKRIDSEYFRKQFLNFFNSVPNLKPLGYFVKDGYRVVYENTNVIEKQKAIDGNCPYFLQATDLKTPFIETSNLFYVNEEDWIRYPKGRIVKGEILIEVKGKIDKVAIVPDDFPEKTLVTGSLFKLTVNEKISKHILLTYLITKYGAAFKDRFKTNLLISFVSKPDLYRIPVPNFSQKIQIEIDKIFNNIFESNKKSKVLYSQAEALLLEALGLNNFQTTADAVNIKSFKESFLKSGRLDAEYYQKKYEDYLNLIFNYSNGWEKIEKACTQKDINFTPNDSTEYKYIELASIGKTGDVKDCTIALGGELPTRARRKVNTNDVIISSIEGSLDSCAIITDEYDNALCSTGFYVLTSKKINSETLLVLFKSEPIQQILKKGCSGTILTAISKSEFQNIPIPIIEIPIQEKIASLVSESFTLKKQSEQLLETAKRAVEIAIEENEDAAIHFINVAIN